MRYDYTELDRRLAVIRIGRRSIAERVRAAIADRLGPEMRLQSASFDQCSRELDAARLRLVLIDQPGGRSAMRFLDVWIRNDGQITLVRFN
jgi:hypothetical protein